MVIGTVDSIIAIRRVRVDDIRKEHMRVVKG
jgi:hypothetical protein